MEPAVNAHSLARIYPMPVTIEQRLAAVERQLRDLTAAQARLHSDIEQKTADQNAAAVRHVESVLAAGLRSLQGDVEDIKRDQKLQLGLLGDAAEERGRRKEREATIELEAKRLALRSSSADIDGKDADVERRRSETIVRRWKGRALAFAIVGAAITGLVGAAIGSHH